MQVSWWVELAVKPDQLANFEKMTGEMVASTRDETGVLAYQRFVTDDRQTVHVYERYENSETAIAHLQKFDATFGERYASMVDRKRFIVFGNPSGELRTLLIDTGPHTTSRLVRLPIGGDPAPLPPSRLRRTSSQFILKGWSGGKCRQFSNFSVSRCWRSEQVSAS
jgi:quinol monooxygenase YgiN